MHRSSTLVFGTVAFVVILMAIISYKNSAAQNAAAHIESRGTLDAPLVDVQSDGDGTRVRAPFVDIDVRKNKTQPDN